MATRSQRRLASCRDRRRKLSIGLKSHRPKDGSYVSDEIGKATVTYAWNDGEISAVCFLSNDDLAHCPGFTPFNETDYDQLSTALSHFPRA
jgi:hypothetical protein